ncbi:hypothetical protein JYU07_00480 [Roseiflexus sp. AH-315-K22]|nr:hypothetical protein [Roseiflexus sp. AH-315-K22]
MAINFDDETYGQCWQVETVTSMPKQHQGASIRARTDRTRQREMALMGITHNITIVLPDDLSYKAFLTSLSSPPARTSESEPTVSPQLRSCLSGLRVVSPRTARARPIMRPDRSHA